MDLPPPVIRIKRLGKSTYSSVESTVSVESNLPLNFEKSKIGPELLKFRIGLLLSQFVSKCINGNESIYVGWFVSPVILT